MANPLPAILSHRAGRLTRRLLTIVALAAGSALFTGCSVDVGWDPTPPYGWTNTFYDSALDGCWRLTTINSQYVSGYSVNYLVFDGYGRGEYLYYDNGRRYVEQTAYWCQRVNNGGSGYQINLQYESDYSPTTMNYWFTDGGDTLWMQWRNSYGLQTYTYTVTNHVCRGDSMTISNTYRTPQSS